MKHIVCFSGGHSSALVALAVVGRHGREAVVLLNHNISAEVEDADIKRFKIEVSGFLGVPITYANIGGLEDEAALPNQFDVVRRIGAFKQPFTGTALCTYELKTKPFTDYLKQNHEPGEAIIYYGFDDDEQDRIARRRDILFRMGYETCFPLAEWPDTLESTAAIGISPPLTYSIYLHGNCAGCLKGGLQHWYVTFCHRPDVYALAEETENVLGYTINRDRSGGKSEGLSLGALRGVFGRMQQAGVPDSEHYSSRKFSHYLKAFKLPDLFSSRGCECSF